MHKLKRTILYILLIFGLATMLTSGYIVGKYYYDIIHSEKIFNDVRDDVESGDEIREPVVNRDSDRDDHAIRHSKYDKLYEKNKNFVGWINIPGTSIDYPVMQTPKDEQYYLHRNFYGEYDFTGTPFANGASNIAKPSENTIIYAHNMKNGSMFAGLLKFESKDYYKKHKIFYFDSIYRSGTYEIIGVVRTDVLSHTYKYYLTSNCNMEEFYEYLDFIKQHSIYKIDAFDNVEYGDTLVTLSTCSYHISNNKGRLLVIGRLAETDDETMINSNKE